MHFIFFMETLHTALKSFPSAKLTCVLIKYETMNNVLSSNFLYMMRI